MNTKNIKKEWLSIFGKDVDKKLIREHLNYVMEKHITSKNGVDLSDFIE